MAHIQWRVGDKNTIHDRDRPTTNKQNEFTKWSVAGGDVDTMGWNTTEQWEA
jgi:hypothetical protein